MFIIVVQEKFKHVKISMKQENCSLGKLFVQAQKHNYLKLQIYSDENFLNYDFMGLKTYYYSKKVKVRPLTYCCNSFLTDVIL